MSNKWGDDFTARKFLEQIRLLNRENAALWEDRLNGGTDVVHGEYDAMVKELAVAVRERKAAQKQMTAMRRQLEAAGIGPTAPQAATKNKLKDACLQAAALLRGEVRAEYVDQAREILEKAVGR